MRNLVFKPILGAFVCCLTLAACGGGSSPSPRITPPPPPPPPPTPVNASIAALTVDEIFAASSAIISFDLANDGTVSNVATGQLGITSASHVDYTHTGANFEVEIAHDGIDMDQAFTADDIDAAASDASFRVYSVASTSRDFIMLIPGDATYGQSYVTLGIWNSPDQNTRDFAFGSIAFGIKTKGADMPTTGSATFNGLTLGNLVAGTTLYRVSGDVAFSVDFGTNAVNGTFTNMGKENVQTGAVSAWRNFTSTGSISTGSLFSGTAASDDAVLSGTLSGSFFGPSAVEIGGTWSLSGTGENAVGAFVGKQ